MTATQWLWDMLLNRHETTWRSRSLVASLLVAVAAVTNLGCNGSSVDQRVVPATLVGDHEPSVESIGLTLTQIGEPSPEKVVVRLTAKNNGAQPVAWDSKFSAVLRWD